MSENTKSMNVEISPMDIQRELMASTKQIKNKKRRINRAMGYYRNQRMIRNSFIENLCNAGHCLVRGLIIGCIAGAMYAGFNKNTNKQERKISRFVSGYYYPYAKQHGMTDAFYFNIAVIFGCALVAYGIRRTRPRELNITERLKTTERDLNRQEHVKRIAYASDIDCAGLDNMYNEMTDAKYKSEILRMARGLAYQDATYLNNFLKHTGEIKNKQIATEIIRGHLMRHPGDITKIKPILGAKYLPANTQKLYTEYNTARGRITKFTTGMRIKKQIRD